MCFVPSLGAPPLRERQVSAPVRAQSRHQASISPTTFSAEIHSQASRRPQSGDRATLLETKAVVSRHLSLSCITDSVASSITTCCVIPTTSCKNILKSGAACTFVVPVLSGCLRCLAFGVSEPPALFESHPLQWECAEEKGGVDPFTGDGMSRNAGIAEKRAKRVGLMKNTRPTVFPKA